MGPFDGDVRASTILGAEHFGPEPSLPMPYNAVKTAIRQFAYAQANNRWQNIKTCRQVKLIIMAYTLQFVGASCRMTSL